MKSPRNRSTKLAKLTKSKVHRMALDRVMEHLELSSAGDQSSPDKIIDVLLSASANRTSIERECDELEGAPSANTVRGVLRDSLELDNTERQLNEALGHDLKPGYWKRPLKVAVDLVGIPYYGNSAVDSDELCRAKAKQGTTYFHVYATVYVIRNNRRVTLALHYVRQGESLVSVLEALKSCLDELGVKVGIWVADRAFCNVAALNWFDQQPEAIVPLVARGKKDPPSGSRVFLQHQYSHWDEYTMKSEKDGELTFAVAVVRQNSKQSRSKRKRIPPTTLAYAVVGKRVRNCSRKRCVTAIAALYRSRFGVESSYRQMNQARLRTSSRLPELRLLAVGLSLLLRNLWALLGWVSLAQKGKGRRKGKSRLRFNTVLRWLSRAVENQLELRTTIELKAPSPVCF